MSSGRFRLPAHKYLLLRMEVAERDEYRCVICGDTSITCHHIDNRSSGGGDYLENCVSLGIRCGCHDRVEQGKIKIPEGVLNEIGYYNNNQRRR